MVAFALPLVLVVFELRQKHWKLEYIYILLEANWSNVNFCWVLNFFYTDETTVDSTLFGPTSHRIKGTAIRYIPDIASWVLRSPSFLPSCMHAVHRCEVAFEQTIRHHPRQDLDATNELEQVSSYSLPCVHGPTNASTLLMKALRITKQTVGATTVVSVCHGNND